MSVLKPQGAHASEFPSKEIQVIVAAAAGGLVDASARNLGKIMEESLGKPVVIVNKPGAASSLALAAIRNARPDGYTIGVHAGVPYTYNPHAQKVDYTLDDFSYIAAIAQFQWAYVSGPDKPWKDFKGLVAYAKTHPGMTYATMHPIGENILNHIAKKEGIEWRAIPTKGGAEVMTAVLGNHVDFAYSAGIHNVHVQAGQMIVLAGHGAARLLGSPDVPRPVPQVHALDHGMVIPGRNWQMEVVAIPHAQPYLECFGYRLDTAEGSFAYSGDAGPSQDFVRLIRGCHVPVHMCHQLSGTQPGPEWARGASGHLEAAKTARDAGVRNLVLTRIPGQMDVPGIRE